MLGQAKPVHVEYIAVVENKRPKERAAHARYEVRYEARSKMCHTNRAVGAKKKSQIMQRMRGRCGGINISPTTHLTGSVPMITSPFCSNRSTQSPAFALLPSAPPSFATSESGERSPHEQRGQPGAPRLGALMGQSSRSAIHVFRGKNKKKGALAVKRQVYNHVIYHVMSCHVMPNTSCHAVFSRRLGQHSHSA